jgi:hypothetical protein
MQVVTVVWLILIEDMNSLRKLIKKVLREHHESRIDMLPINEDMENEYVLEQWYTDEEIAEIAFSEAVKVLSKTMKD